MVSQKRSFILCFAAIGNAVAASIALLCISSPAPATIVPTADPEDGFGATPEILTVDVWMPPVTTTAKRGVAGTRQLRQTFKNPDAFNVGQINIGFDGGPDVDLGMKIRFYEVDDVVAGTIMEGDLIKELNYMGVVPNSMDPGGILRLDLTGGDVFRLPARFEGTAGYAIEFSTPFALASDPSIGQVVHTHDEVDYYLDGAFYIEGGGISGGNITRDLGISLIATDQPVFIPGDTNGDDIIDVETDLAAIAAHFRQNVTMIAEGDIDGDGFVDFTDFDIWKRNYPSAVGAGALSFLNIPEPNCALLLFAGLWGVAVVGGRWRASTGC